VVREQVKAELFGQDLAAMRQARTADKSIIKIWSGYAKSKDQKALLQEIRKIAPERGYRIDFGNISDEEASVKELVDFAISAAGKQDGAVTVLPSDHKYVQSHLGELKSSHVIFMDYDASGVNMDSFFQIGGIIAAGVAYITNNDIAFMNTYRLLTDDSGHLPVTIDELKRDPLRLKFLIVPIKIINTEDLKHLNDRMRDLLFCA